MILQGRVAIITGGGRGIGRAIARTFAKEGAAVVISARTATEVAATAAEIERQGGKVLPVTADVSRDADCEKLLQRALETFGKVDVLVNNAGILGPVRPAQDTTPAEWDQVLGINLRGPFLLSRLVLPGMYERGYGVMLNLVSIAAKAAFSMNSAYAASKAGLMGLTRTLAAEGARKGVRVNALSPGPVAETSMLDQLQGELMRHTKADRQTIAAGMVAGILQGRPQTEDEIAAAALFLVSDQASAITGQTMNVDGGMAFY